MNEDEDFFSDDLIDNDIIDSIEKSVNEMSPRKRVIAGDGVEQSSRGSTRDEEEGLDEEDEVEYSSESWDDDFSGDDIEEIDRGKAWDPNTKKGISSTTIKLIVSGVIVLICVICMLIFGVKDDKESKEDTPSKQETQSNQMPQQSQSGIQETDSSKSYDSYVELPEKFYSDTMVISKFTRVSDNVCSFHVLGIPSNYKREVSFEIDVEEYNSLANGSIVNIDYKIFTKDSIDYLTGIKLNIEKGK